MKACADSSPRSVDDRVGVFLDANLGAESCFRETRNWDVSGTSRELALAFTATRKRRQDFQTRDTISILYSCRMHAKHSPADSVR